MRVAVGEGVAVDVAVDVAVGVIVAVGVLVGVGVDVATTLMVLFAAIRFSRSPERITALRRAPLSENVRAVELRTDDTARARTVATVN